MQSPVLFCGCVNRANLYGFPDSVGTFGGVCLYDQQIFPACIDIFRSGVDNKRFVPKDTDINALGSVSYTHLTLPTTERV